MSYSTESDQKPVDNCFVCKKLSSLKCSNCVKVFYCSVEHQRGDWKRHKRYELTIKRQGENKSKTYKIFLN